MDFNARITHCLHIKGRVDELSQLTKNIEIGLGEITVMTALLSGVSQISNYYDDSQFSFTAVQRKHFGESIAPILLPSSRLSYLSTHCLP